MTSSTPQNPRTDGQSSGAVDTGIFNVKSIMDQFYNWNPGENDDEGRAIKNTTAADMVMSAFQTQLATGMAHQQAGISKDMMGHQQMLERQAAGEARNEEFQYGMQTICFKTLLGRIRVSRTGLLSLFSMAFVLLIASIACYHCNSVCRFHII